MWRCMDEQVGDEKHISAGAKVRSGRGGCEKIAMWREVVGSKYGDMKREVDGAFRRWRVIDNDVDRQRRRIEEKKVEVGECWVANAKTGKER